MLRRSGFAAIAVLLLTAGSGAAATGYLVNVEAGTTTVKAGSNVFGGQGDTVDVGLFNSQCTDEDDVVDVGVANEEGNGQNKTSQDGTADPGFQCNDPNEDCTAEEGGGVLVVLFGETIIVTQNPLDDIVPTSPEFPVDDSGGDGDARCTDDGDSVDVGVANDEGTAGGDRKCEATFDPAERGDRDDGVDVGVLNRECNDHEDADDVGVINCETNDPNDGIDAGVFNSESTDDANDTLDLSVFNGETGDAPDRNGLNVGPAMLGRHLCVIEPPEDFCLQVERIVICNDLCRELGPFFLCLGPVVDEFREQTGIP